MRLHYVHPSRGGRRLTFPAVKIQPWTAVAGSHVLQPRFLTWGARAWRSPNRAALREYLERRIV